MMNKTVKIADIIHLAHAVDTSTIQADGLKIIRLAIKMPEYVIKKVYT